MLGSKSVWLLAAPLSLVWTKKQHIADYRQHAARLTALCGKYDWAYPPDYQPPPELQLRVECPRRPPAWHAGSLLSSTAVAALAAAAGAAAVGRSRRLRPYMQSYGSRPPPPPQPWRALHRHPPREVVTRFCQVPCVIGCFEDCSALTFKHKLFLNLSQYCIDRPVIGTLRCRTPLTFLYSVSLGPAAGAAFTQWALQQVAEKRCSGIWIAKGTASANGSGVIVSRDPEVLLAGVARTKTPADKQGTTVEAAVQREHWVLQEFIEHSPLLRRRRFSIRAFALAVGTVAGLDIYMWRRANVAVCLSSYGPGKAPAPGEEGQVYCPKIAAAITNFRAQKSAVGQEAYDAVKAQHFMSFDDACQELPALRSVWPRIVEITVECFAACLGRPDFLFCPGAFELFGFDFIVERLPCGKLVPLVLEANLRPGYATNRSVIESLVGDAVNLTMDYAFAERLRDSSCGWKERFSKVASFLSADIPPHGSGEGN